MIFQNSLHALDNERKIKFVIQGLLSALAAIGVRGDEKVTRMIYA